MNFKEAITDPAFFIGRSTLISGIQKSSTQVYILLGGRRIGKTSTLNAIQWSLLTLEPAQFTSFPVLIDLQVERPKSLGSLKYLLISRLCESVERWRKVEGSPTQGRYNLYLAQGVDTESVFDFLELLGIEPKIDTSDRILSHDDFRRAFLRIREKLKQQGFSGVCFLLDGAEYIAYQKNWANDAWSYFRGLKDSEPAIKSFLGLVLSGYRELKEYQQEVGSKLLDISETEWLSPLTDSEVLELIHHRMETGSQLLTEEDIKLVQEWAGSHPYLTQRFLDAIEDFYNEEQSSLRRIENREDFIESLLYQHDHDFSAWWNRGLGTGALGDNERLIYHSLIEHRTATIRSLANYSRLSRMDVKTALEVLVGTGIVQELGYGQFKIGARLFEEWVTGT